MSERWKAIAGYEGLYEVSDCGRVRSLTRVVPSVMSSTGTRTHKGKMLAPSKINGRYVCVVFSKNGKVKSFEVHRLVLTAFVGPPKKGDDCCHFNGDKHDNRVGNLRWGTRKENFADSMRLGSVSKGEQHYLAKLTDDDVREIRRLVGPFKNGKAPYGSIAALAPKYGMSSTSLAAAVRRKTWKHVA